MSFNGDDNRICESVSHRVARRPYRGLLPHVIECSQRLETEIYLCAAFEIKLREGRRS